MTAGPLAPVSVPLPTLIPPVPSEVTLVEKAVANGDLNTVQRTLEQYIQRTFDDQIKMCHFSCALQKSYLEKVNMPILSYLLSKGVPVSVIDFTFAAKNKSYELMELFLNHGYDINSSVDMTFPPALRYYEVSSMYYRCILIESQCCYPG